MIAKLFMDLIFHLVKRFPVCCFFVGEYLLWFGFSPREVLVKTTYGGGRFFLEVVFIVKNLLNAFFSI